MDKAPVEIPYLTPSPNYQAALWTLLSLTLLSTAVRVYCRAHVLKAFGVDDWLITAAAVSMVFCLLLLFKPLGSQFAGSGNRLHCFSSCQTDVLVSGHRQLHSQRLRPNGAL